MTSFTPNAKLTLIDADRKVWAETMNRNLATIDALIGAYFVVNNLRGVWQNSTSYAVNEAVIDDVTSAVYLTGVAHTSAAIPTTFAEDRAANPSYWTIYSSPARARGPWAGPGVGYAINDFVTAGARTAVALVSHTSTGSFDNDLASGYWSILVDLSLYGIMPTPTLNENKFTVINSAGTDYLLVDASDARVLLGITSVGSNLITAVDAAAMRVILGVGASGDFQPLDADLTAIAALTTAAFGRSLLAAIDAAAVRTALALGTAALLNSGVANGNVPVMDATGYPVANGSQITNVAAATAAAVAATGVTAGSLPATVIPQLTKFTNSLAADVEITATATWTDGPTVAQGSTGVFLAIGTVSIDMGLFAGGTADVKLWDGTTVIASAHESAQGASATETSVSLSGYITNPTGNIRMSVKVSHRNPTAWIFADESGAAKDSTVSAIRIG